MSWMEDEWKDELPRAALERITSMEANLERLNKDIKQYQHKTDTLEANSLKAKKDLEEETKSHQETRRDKLTIEKKLNDLLSAHERMVEESKCKKLTIDRLNEQVEKLRFALSEKTAESCKLFADLESLRCKYEHALQENSGGDVDRLREASSLNQQRLEDLKGHIEALIKEKQELKAQYEDDANQWSAERERLERDMNSSLAALQRMEDEVQAKTKDNIKLFDELQELRDCLLKAEDQAKDRILDAAPSASPEILTRSASSLKLQRQHDCAKQGIPVDGRLREKVKSSVQNFGICLEEGMSSHATESELRTLIQDLYQVLKDDEEEKLRMQHQIVTAERAIKDLNMEKSVIEESFAELQEHGEEDKRKLLKEIARLKQVEQDLELRIGETAGKDGRRQQTADQLFLEVLELREKVSELEKANRNFKRESATHIRSVATLKTEFEADPEQKMKVQMHEVNNEKEYVVNIESAKIDDDPLVLSPCHSRQNLCPAESRTRLESMAWKDLQTKLEKKFAEERRKLVDEIHVLKRELKDRDRQLFFFSTETEKFKMPFQAIAVNPSLIRGSGCDYKSPKGKASDFSQDGVQDSGVSLTGDSLRKVEAFSFSMKRQRPVDESDHGEISDVARCICAAANDALQEVDSNLLRTPQKSFLRSELASSEKQSSVNSISDAEGTTKFVHGEHCESIWQQLQIAKAANIAYEREAAKLRMRIEEMEMRHNCHMAECGDRQKEVEVARLAVQSMEKVAVEGYAQQEEVVMDLERKLLEEQEKCRRLARSLRRAREMPSNTENHVSRDSDKDDDVCQESRSNVSRWECVEDKLDKVLAIVTRSDRDFHLLRHDVIPALAEEIKDIPNRLRAEINDGNKRVRESLKKLLERRLPSKSPPQSSRRVPVSTGRYTPEPELKQKHASAFDSWNSDSSDAKCSSVSRRDFGGAIEDIERVKNRLTGVQRSMQAHAAGVKTLEGERDRLQEELVRMVDILKGKDEESRRFENLMENEKRKTEENNSCFRSEMEALKAEQLEIYQEFREMCDNLKKKDIELLNKTKQLKLLSAEWREKEDSLQDRIEQLQVEKSNTLEQNDELKALLDDCKLENELMRDKLGDREKNLQRIFDGLSHVETVFLNARKSGLYH